MKTLANWKDRSFDDQWDAVIGSYSIDALVLSDTNGESIVQYSVSNTMGMGSLLAYIPVLGRDLGNDIAPDDGPRSDSTMVLQWTETISH